MPVTMPAPLPLRPGAQRLLCAVAALLLPAIAVGHGQGAASATQAALAATPLDLPAATADADIARVDGERIGRNGLLLLQAYLSLEQRKPSLPQLRDEVIEQRLLARHAEKTFTQAELFPEQRVAFAPQAAVDDRLVGLLRTLYRDRLDSALQAEAGNDLARAIIAQTLPDAAGLQAALGDPRRLRVEYRLSESEQAAAAQLQLLHYRLPSGGEGRISLADIYARQNVQGRISLHQLDRDFLAAQLRTRLLGLLSVDWASRQAGVAAIAELRRNLYDRELARALMARYGLGTDMHASSEHLQELRSRVTQAEVNAWYDADRERFRRLERVRARHIRLADQATADRVARLLRKDGSNFAEIARQFSIAPDAAGGGQLGWLARKNEADWFSELAFAQPPQRNSAAVRTPAATAASAQWEIVRVDEQQFGHHPRDSETVRYLAAQAIAEQKARQEFAALRQRLQAKARIVLAQQTPATAALR
ncbi:parvulin-like peptidyl-prolyl cis-trans isomerase protein [Tahibacter aquaticus]|uniref:peptidylprolyl isomerase n=1 Tax=Tahibacter aquaticus TaxID=520092 RepID=A0A4R6Z515_9GAMM|nr:peptidylprolyl isomerase [Tahibacter aquaticus]TDR46649.1 parvulin-like peptidyl-prolyl cis-trans isomerase protein [Tahibacter aquaticus]